MSQGEFDLVATLRALFAQHPSAGAVPLGIGDDAAWLAADPRGLVISVDTQVEHVHFERAWLSLEDIGYRAFVAALSDLAAMGAAPHAALSSLIVPAADAGALVPAIARGQAEAALAYACPVVGGNLSRGQTASITTTVLGHVAAPLLRAAAAPGHDVFVAGAIGLAAAGLRAHQLGRAGGVLANARAAWARPKARLQEGLAAAAVGGAAIDLSDGLAQDLAHVAQESGVCIALDRDALAPFATALATEALALDGADPWEWVLFGGEDYALAFTGSEPPAGFVRIGRVVSGAGVTLAGNRLTSRGHRHFDG